MEIALEEPSTQSPRARAARPQASSYASRWASLKLQDEEVPAGEQLAAQEWVGDQPQWGGGGSGGAQEQEWDGVGRAPWEAGSPVDEAPEAQPQPQPQLQAQQAWGAADGAQAQGARDGGGDEYLGFEGEPEAEQAQGGEGAAVEEQPPAPARHPLLGALLQEWGDLSEGEDGEQYGQGAGGAAAPAPAAPVRPLDDDPFATGGAAVFNNTAFTEEGAGGGAHEREGAYAGGGASAFGGWGGAGAGMRNAFASPAGREPSPFFADEAARASHEGSLFYSSEEGGTPVGTSALQQRSTRWRRPSAQQQQQQQQ